MGNISSSDEAQFRTLIAAKDVAFSAPFSSLPGGLILAKYGQYVAAISCRKGLFLDVDGLPVISLKFWRNHGQSFIV